jgi:hypothetical protein
MVRAPTTVGQIAFLRRLFPYLPFAVRRPGRALLIGPGAGLEVHLASLAGTDHVTAVEINPAIIRLVRRWRHFTGSPYESPNVQLFIEEGRQFLISHPGSYDLIQMALAFTATAQSGTFTLVESHLYTLEAYRLYLDRLKPHGLLAILDDSQDRTLRQVMTALTVFQERGLSPKEAMKRIAVLQNPGHDGPGYFYMVLISPNALEGRMCRRIIDLSAQGGFIPWWVPGLAAQQPFVSLSEAGSKPFLIRQAADYGPRTDDFPFFFFFGKGWLARWRVLQTVALIGLWSLLLSGTAAWGLARRLGAGSRRAAFLASACGTAFMLTEAGLLQVLTLATRGPAQALSLLLFSILFWCGIGSRIAETLASRAAVRLSSLFALAGTLAVLYAICLHGARVAAWIPSPSLRLAALWLILAPIGLSLGTPFPALLKLNVRRGFSFTAALWAVNGLSSVTGGALAIIIAFCYGTRTVLLTAAGLYGLAALASLGLVLLPTQRPR